MKKDKNTILPILIGSAKNYNSNLCNNNVLFLYRHNNTIGFKEVVFNDYNFLHLTGVNTRLPAKLFYNACLEGKLSINDFELKKDGTSILKLSVLPYLSKLILTPTLIGNFNNFGFNLQTDYLIGDTKKIFLVGFKTKYKYDFPNTLLAGDLKHYATQAHKIIAVFVKNKDNKAYFKNTYIHKDTELSKLQIPKELKDKLIID